MNEEIFSLSEKNNVPEGIQAKEFKIIPVDFCNMASMKFAFYGLTNKKLNCAENDNIIKYKLSQPSKKNKKTIKYGENHSLTWLKCDIENKKKLEKKFIGDEIKEDYTEIII